MNTSALLAVIVILALICSFLAIVCLYLYKQLFDAQLRLEEYSEVLELGDSEDLRC